MTASGCGARPRRRRRGQATIEFALVAPLFLLALLASIDAALWSLETSDVVASSESGIRVAVSAYGTPSPGKTTTPDSEQVAAAIAPRMRQALFATAVVAWPAAQGACPATSAGVEQALGARVVAVCVENRGGFVHLVLIGNVASLVPPLAGLWRAGEIPIRVGAVSHTLTFE
ncbi:MAG: TadE/TadG family type IV pilus assembly protein [Candidatus Dormibacteria bacterium]